MDTHITIPMARPVAGPVEPTVRPRAAFEAWISGPPYEREVERFGEGSAWPGNYRELDVDLAWCAWSAAVALTRERCAALCDAEAQAREQAAHKTHGSGSPAYGRQMAGVNAAKNCAKAIRGA